MTELAVLQGVRLKGRISPADLAATLGADLSDITPIVERLTAAGLLAEGATLRITQTGSERLA
ncbi:MAG TPA: MarR family transcriptional regulator, partial [Mycobacterium sp.]|nr:MarR family transcriptional regulator [Mycobacterium sp.]